MAQRLQFSTQENEASTERFVMTYMIDDTSHRSVWYLRVGELLPSDFALASSSGDPLGFRMGNIGSDTNTAWAVLEHVLANIESLHVGFLKPRKGVKAVHLQIARLEFYRFPSPVGGAEVIGMAAFDSTGQPLFTVRDATLGYSGSGPILSSNIAAALGITPEMFEEINTSVSGGGHYALVVSREITEESEVEDLPIPVPVSYCDGPWRWRHASSF